MPYITEAKKTKIDFALAQLGRMEHGDLTYAITALMNRYVGHHGRRYTVLSQARASCADASTEFYRRVMAPYEETKRAQNGDAYPAVPDVAGRDVR